MEARTLWLYNPTTSDVSISDLGVKVPAGKAVNVYQANPYLTTSKVNDSLESGAIARRLEAKVLRVVKKKPTTVRPKNLDLIKTSDKTVVAKKTKSSVVIDSGLTDEDLGESGEFDFADYGINDLGPVEHIKDKASVIVQAKQDDMEAQPEGAKLEPKTETNVSKQTQIIMDLADKASDPMGKIADTSSTSAQPFIVAKPPTPDPEPEVKVEVKPKVRQTETKEVVVEGQTSAERSLTGGDIADKDDVIALDTIDVMKVATKTDDGAIVMELTEEETAEEDTKVVTKKRKTTVKK